MKIKTVFIMVLAMGCALFVKTPRFDHIPVSENHLSNPDIYCRYSLDEDDKYCMAIILFPSGDMIGHTTGIPLDSIGYLASRPDLYDQWTYAAQWGKYWMIGDTLFFQYAHFANMGGSVHYPLISRKARLGGDTLITVPQFHHTIRHARYFWANDTLIYTRTAYPDIYNIDPSKAWINRE